MMQRGAIFSDDRKYRYALERVWDDQGERVLFVMLNPSFADANTDDPTIRRCIGFAQKWGYGGVAVGNLFAMVSTEPASLFGDECPVGPENDSHLQRLAEDCPFVVAAWGDALRRHPLFRKREATVRDLLRPRSHGLLHCLGITAYGTPKHPLRLSADTQIWPLPGETARMAGRGLTGSGGIVSKRFLDDEWEAADWWTQKRGTLRRPAESKRCITMGCRWDQQTDSLWCYRCAEEILASCEFCGLATEDCRCTRGQINDGSPESVLGPDGHVRDCEGAGCDDNCTCYCHLKVERLDDDADARTLPVPGKAGAE
jgi:hypothetical protein